MTAKELTHRNLIKSLGDFLYFDTDSLKIQDNMFNYYSTYHKKHIILYPVDPSIYTLSVQDFLSVIEDAETNGIEVHYIDGKLYYSYII